jgi:hypothetical protein
MNPKPTARPTATDAAMLINVNAIATLLNFCSINQQYLLLSDFNFIFLTFSDSKHFIEKQAAYSHDVQHEVHSA